MGVIQERVARQSKIILFPVRKPREVFFDIFEVTIRETYIRTALILF